MNIHVGACVYFSGVSAEQFHFLSRHASSFLPQRNTFHYGPKTEWTVIRAELKLWTMKTADDLTQTLLCVRISWSSNHSFLL